MDPGYGDVFGGGSGVIPLLSTKKVFFPTWKFMTA